ncbi:cysteine synthase family protein [Marinobacter nanhaiticus D15-8W]|uniref:cysteine synthase n=1 Tax=Marinobacter nanhaiticus D15-8W TaxID=626887 RepID=N6WMK5_9GAMM|nr:cysteine synthase family protein [Marinobacter nanhaiticus]ENO12691.1 cysteine synthase family protein [Marinobacter nanhaiticus D15-8W]BES70030.1 cysteine synthase family protein [Marinobacter nanhaiticus D15-8W]
MIYKAMHQMIGGTPILEMGLLNSKWRLLLKIEKFNPGMSMKDRMARQMIFDALDSGRLTKEGVIVESSSGNTATGIAYIASELGIRFIAVVDHHAAEDKINTIKAYGGEIHMIQGDYADNEVATVEREATAARLAKKIPGAVFFDQSNNFSNPKGYALTLAQEILSDVGPDLDEFIACVGTGGSLTGTAQVLKDEIPNLKVIGVEPKGSTVFGYPGGPYYQSGTGVPPGDKIGVIYKPSLLDEGVIVNDQKAFTTCKYLAQEHGLLVGGSAGGAIYEAVRRSIGYSGSGTSLCLVCDGGEKYLSTVFNNTWLEERGLYCKQTYRFLKSVLSKPSYITTKRNSVADLEL